VPKYPDEAARLPPETGRPKACAFLRHPFPDCYCLNISGAKIPRMVEYCAGDFASCQIFRRWTGQSAQTPAAGPETPPIPGPETP